VKKFPGARSLRNSPAQNLEAALIADGVALDKLYPLDVDRAFKKLEEIKPHITVWWTSGAQAAQLAKDGEVDLMGIWSNRMQSVIDDGAKAAYGYEGGIMIPDCFFIPKGAKKRDLAVKAIAVAASPEVPIPYGCDACHAARLKGRSRMRWRWSAWRNLPTAPSINSRAVRSSGSRWPGRSSFVPASC
jgi:spermidine/putrescine-binding protein